MKMEIKSLKKLLIMYLFVQLFVLVSNKIIQAQEFLFLPEGTNRQECSFLSPKGVITIPFFEKIYQQRYEQTKQEVDVLPAWLKELNLSERQVAQIVTTAKEFFGERPFDNNDAIKEKIKVLSEQGNLNYAEWMRGVDIQGGKVCIDGLLRFMEDILKMMRAEKNIFIKRTELLNLKKLYKLNKRYWPQLEQIVQKKDLSRRDLEKIKEYLLLQQSMMSFKGVSVINSKTKKQISCDIKFFEAQFEVIPLCSYRDASLDMAVFTTKPLEDKNGEKVVDEHVKGALGSVSFRITEDAILIEHIQSTVHYLLNGKLRKETYFWPELAVLMLEKYAFSRGITRIYMISGDYIQNIYKGLPESVADRMYKQVAENLGYEDFDYSLRFDEGIQFIPKKVKFKDLKETQATSQGWQLTRDFFALMRKIEDYYAKPAASQSEMVLFNEDNLNSGFKRQAIVNSMSIQVIENSI